MAIVEILGPEPNDSFPYASFNTDHFGLLISTEDREAFLSAVVDAVRQADKASVDEWEDEPLLMELDLPEFDDDLDY